MNSLIQEVLSSQLSEQYSLVGEIHDLGYLKHETCGSQTDLTTKHAVLKDKPIAFFQRELDELRQSKAVIVSCVTPVAKAQKASYCASLRIAKAGKPRNIGEELCLPLAKEITHIMCGEKATRQLNLVPLSNDTVSRRIVDMADGVKNILIEHIKKSRYFSIQLDETTDVVDLANLLVYVRYEYDGTSQEDFLSVRHR
ncbi:Zinc finger BED domain-containing protein 5-like [Oopsacas minuta]|uniref:Zinc finger BED domain-containing protein 5-like n=1 Tax=Oopsacas minuta TaxID=111878 RepID=A0AAV7JMN8_9METZ|nr:Zinc finger BED domain-containing protein 5-like [Oopsacas minuta]